MKFTQQMKDILAFDYLAKTPVALVAPKTHQLNHEMIVDASRELFKNTIGYGYHSNKRIMNSIEIQYLNDKDWMIDNYPELVLKIIGE